MDQLTWQSNTSRSKLAQGSRDHVLTLVQINHNSWTLTITHRAWHQYQVHSFLCGSWDDAQNYAQHYYNAWREQMTTSRASRELCVNLVNAWVDLPRLADTAPTQHLMQMQQRNALAHCIEALLKAWAWNDEVKIPWSVVDYIDQQWHHLVCAGEDKD